MKKPYRQADGFYHVGGKKYKTLFGSREKVMNGTVYKTTGGLIKADLVMNKWGRIVSANKYKTAKKEMRLQKHGFFAKKGKFGAVTRKVRGGKVHGGTTIKDPIESNSTLPSSTQKTKSNRTYIDDKLVDYVDPEDEMHEREEMSKQEEEMRKYEEEMRKQGKMFDSTKKGGADTMESTINNTRKTKKYTKPQKR